jgi:hypothetical protein
MSAASGAVPVLSESTILLSEFSLNDFQHDAAFLSASFHRSKLTETHIEKAKKFIAFIRTYRNDSRLSAMLRFGVHPMHPSSTVNSDEALDSFLSRLEAIADPTVEFTAKEAVYLRSVLHGVAAWTPMCSEE